MAAQWVCAELLFASFYSYRVPDASPSFAPASPVPSPAALRLALVDAAIQAYGSVSRGEEVFELVKCAPLRIVPPERVSVVKAFVKRLKPGKKKELVESTGVREYCHAEGPLQVYLQLDNGIERLAGLFPLLRRLGTTDSLVSCRVSRAEPSPELCCRIASELPLIAANFQRRAVFTLNEIGPNTRFEQINPFSAAKRGKPFEKQLFILPLIKERLGENWVIYRREPLSH
jgi:hypothetical protein